jgi:hypothetical protein
MQAPPGNHEIQYLMFCTVTETTLDVAPWVIDLAEIQDSSQASHVDAEHWQEVVRLPLCCDLLLCC